MPTSLELAVDSLADPAVALRDALRRLVVVSRRMGADELSAWLRSELDGYTNDADMPIYRDASSLPISISFNGPFGSTATRRVSGRELPDELGGVTEGLFIRQPVAELEALCLGDDDPQMNLPVQWIGRFRHYASEGKVPHMEMMELDHAAIVMPRTYLTGLLDRVKSTALDLALSIEDVSPDVGSPGGPTVSDEPRLSHEIRVQLTQIFNGASNVTIGDNAAVASGEGAIAVHVLVGDVQGLLQAASALLDGEGVEALAEALEQDGDQPGEQTRGFLDRVQAGGYLLAGGVTTNGAYDGLVQLLGQVFPGAFS